MADRLGPIFTIWLGQRRVILVSSWDLAKECLTIHDKALATRPFLAAGKYMGYNYSMFALAPYGLVWRETRKIATLHLLSARQLELMKDIRINELNLSLRHLHSLWVENGERPVKVDLKKWFADITFNNVVNMVTGKRYYGSGVDEEEAGRYKQTFAQFFYLTGVITPSDCVPWLEWLGIDGKIRAMKKTMREMDMFANGWIEEHRRKKESGESPTGSMVEVMLSMADSLQLPGCDPQILIKAIALKNKRRPSPFPAVTVADIEAANACATSWLGIQPRLPRAAC